MHSFMIENNEHKKAKGVNKNVVAIISRNEYKDALLSKKCISHSMNRIWSSDHRIRAMQSTKFNCLVLMSRYISQAMDMME